MFITFFISTACTVWHSVALFTHWLTMHVPECLTRSYTRMSCKGLISQHCVHNKGLINVTTANLHFGSGPWFPGFLCVEVILLDMWLQACNDGWTNSFTDRQKNSSTITLFISGFILLFVGPVSQQALTGDQYKKCSEKEKKKEWFHYGS